ncbi:MAG: hypothetical protein COB65_10670 [Thalassobium sp.]|uniref:hypothetical protein n=1 Tax=Octadecabacter sp. SW4 TaxID=2602067 RepID=UPI000C120F27|nr:hypothetical protein [Octadecabacter sp. SW4]PHQ80982.1 MAG: hypothetical protein COB65_10670 [Thalassobium sp.]QEE36761.1 hypothetical protein FTO60_14150 [Octadecabacter sp. SW4]
MNPDVMLVIGLIVAAFSIPPILGAFAEGRAPRAAAIMVLIGGGLIALAVSQKPGGYEINEIPNVFVRVVGQLIR